MRIDVCDEHGAEAAVERFNAFHDGFIRELRLFSHDTFEDRHTHSTTGYLDLRFLFAHSNYDEGRPPFDQVVEAEFFAVRDLTVEFTGLPTDWPIDGLELGTTAAEPLPGAAGGTPEGRRLSARLLQPRLLDGSRWERTETLSFTFSHARFEEVEGDVAS